MLAQLWQSDRDYGPTTPSNTSPIERVALVEGERGAAMELMEKNAKINAKRLKKRMLVGLA